MPCLSHRRDRAPRLSRREVLRGASSGVAAAEAEAALGSAAAPAAGAQGTRRVADLAHAVSAAFPTCIGEPGLPVERAMTFAENGFNLNELPHDAHVGTPVDAPIRVAADGRTGEAIPLGDPVAPLCIGDVRERADADPDAQVTPDDPRAWIDADGPIPDGACAAMNSGRDARAPGEGRRDAEADEVMRFPGYHGEAATMPSEETNAIGVATDRPSLDFGPSGGFATHHARLPANRWEIACLAGLTELPATGAIMVVGRPKVANGAGGPARILALTCGRGGGPPGAPSAAARRRPARRPRP